MLHLGGRPTAVLCAQRAATTGRPVIVATSTEHTDNALAATLAQSGIPYFRGSPGDVLHRFAEATHDFKADTIIVRLTADNVFPDGTFIECLLDSFRESGLSYLGTRSPQDGLPYGLSAEAFTVAALRAAERSTTDAFDREHVTPWIRRNGLAGMYVYPGAKPHWSRLRCTLDNYEDYQMLTRVFGGLDDPINVSWQDLVDRLTDASVLRDAPRCPFKVVGDQGSIHSVLTVGTAQLGGRYGIANQTGAPGDTETRQLLLEAIDAGVTAIDTARAYGDAEQRIGCLLPSGGHDRIRIVTKLDLLDRILPANAQAAAVEAAVDASVFRSVYALRTERIDALLLHRWSYRSAFGGVAWKRLLELKHDGVIARLGASVSNPGEAISALEDPDVGQLQCPVNLLDRRWRNSEFIAAICARPDVIVHARSTLLQGLLTLPPSRWIPGVNAFEICSALDDWVGAFGRTDRADLCMAYVRALPWVTSLVVGMERVEQLSGNLERIQFSPLTEDQVRAIDQAPLSLPDWLLDPSRWRIGYGA